jgi:uncharacterized protein (TIGR02145 family)
MKKVTLVSLALLALLFTTCKKEEEQTEKKVTSVEILADDPLQLEVDGSVTLAVQVLPKDATDKSVKWESSDDDIVTVNKNGKIIGISEGTATITATSTSRKTKSDSITVKVVQPVPVTAISLSNKTLETGDTITVSAVVSPANFTSILTWTIANSSIATIIPFSGNKCKVEGKTVGTTTLTVTADNGKTTSCTITVTKKVEVATLSLANQTVDIGETVTVSAVVMPANFIGTLSWTIASSSIATIAPVSGSKDCKVTGVAVGTTTLTVSADGKTASCNIKVRPVGGVLINGVVWAQYNVDAPGTFAATPQAAGKFYKWNINTAWATTGDVSGWDATVSTGTTWEAANDPSPAGWRVPTMAELQTLIVTSKVTNVWITQSGVNGRLFTDIATGNTLFLPAAGYRTSGSDNFELVGRYGGYWSSTQYQESSTLSYDLDFRNDYVVVNPFYRVNAQSVRPVKD